MGHEARLISVLITQVDLGRPAFIFCLIPDEKKASNTQGLG